MLWQKLKNNRKWTRALSAVLLMAFVFNFISPSVALAVANGDKVLEGAPTSWWANVAFWGLNLILTATLFLTARFLDLAGMFFDLAFGYNFDGFIKNRTMIEAGWTISRDVANIFFILILLGIAISTILQIQSYGAKQLLAKLIIIAIIINFSLPIGYVIIDFTNLLSRGFYDALVPTAQSSISGSLMAGTAISQIFNLKEQPASGGSVANYGLGGVLAGVTAGCAIGVVVGGPAGCLVGALTKGAIGGGLVAGVLAWFNWGSGTSFKEGANYFAIVMMSNILVFPLLFVFLFGGILLIIRFVVLFFLLVLAPIAFVSYILPDTRGKIWQKWWDEFLCQAFFLPAFMFLLYIAILFTNTWARFTWSGAVQANGAFLFNTIIICAFLISALVVSKKMGCYGGGAVMTVATKGKTMLVGYAGAAALRNTTGWVGEKLGQKEWVQKNYYASRAAKGMYGYAGKGVFAKPGASREDVAGKRAQFDLESTFKKSPDNWHKDFANNKGYAYREAFAREIMKDEKKREQFMKTADAGIKGEMLNIVRLKLGSDAEKIFQKSERANERNTELAGGKSIGSFMDGLSTEEAKKLHFKDLNARDQAELFSQWQSDTTKRALVQNWAKTELKPEEQEKFFMESVRKATPELKGEMFKDLSQDMQNKVIESMSPREAVEMRQNAGEHTAVVEEAIKRMPTDKQERIREEEARVMVKDLDKIALDWGTLSKEQKKATAGVLNKDDLQKVARKVADKDKFVDDIQKYTPNKTADVVAVLPEYAGKIGKNPEEVVDWEKVSSANTNLKPMMTKVKGKGVKKIMERGDKVTADYVQEINSMGDNIDDIADSLEKNHNNPGMATMLRLNPQMQQLVILPQKRIRRGGGGGGTGGSGGGGTGGGAPPGGGTPPSSDGGTIIMPSSGFGGGPKTPGTSGQTSPTSTPPPSTPPPKKSP